LNLPDCDEVLEALAHLQSLNLQVPAVQEVVHPLPAATAPRNSNSQITTSSSSSKSEELVVNQLLLGSSLQEVVHPLPAAAKARNNSRHSSKQQQQKQGRGLKPSIMKTTAQQGKRLLLELPVRRVSHQLCDVKQLQV
jgi:hypothetical protein